MKKILFLLLVAPALLFTACDPMSDINDEIDKLHDTEDSNALYLSGLEVAPEEYTLTDEDYELSSNESVANYKNFSASALPKDYLPEILNQKFSGEDAQSMLVTYDYYSYVSADEDNAYELSDADYESMGQSYHNFSDEDVAEALIAKLLDRIVYADEEGTEKTVEYTLFSTNDTRYVQVNADGSAEAIDYSSDAVEVDSAIYEATGNGYYYNFFTIDDAVEDLAKYAVDSSLAPITYAAKVYKNYYTEYAVFYFNGTNWEAKQSVMAVTEPLNFALDADDISQSYWWADPAIKITLGSDDYGSNEYTSNYSNFDLRSGKTPGAIGYKEDEDGNEIANDQLEEMVDMIGAMLDLNHGAVEDQQYLVTYAYYDGGSGTSTIRIIKVDGEWEDYITYVNLQ